MLLSKESRIWGPAFLSVQGANPEGELSREGMLFWRFYVCVCIWVRWGWRGGRVSIAQWSYRLPSLSAATATADELLHGIIWYRLANTHTHTNAQKLLARWPPPRATGHLAVTSKWWFGPAHQINARHRPYNTLWAGKHTHSAQTHSQTCSPNRVPAQTFTSIQVGVVFLDYR